MIQMSGASYRRGIRLAKAGCALPYIDALPGKNRFRQRGLFVEQTFGCEESFAFDVWGATGYVIGLRVGTERSRGAIVTRFDFVPPWPDHSIDWDYYADDVIPKIFLRRYEKLLMSSRLPTILKERRKLYRGVPVEGLLWGKAWAQIPPSPQRVGPALAEITLTDDFGERASCPIKLSVYNPAPQYARTRHHRRLFEDLENARNRE